jgi:hypothetical protein
MIGQITANTLQFGLNGLGALTVHDAVTIPAQITNLTLNALAQIRILSGDSVTDANAGATITLQTDTTPYMLSGAVNATNNGTVVVAVASIDKGIDIGGTTVNYLALPSSILNDISANTLQIGSTSETSSPVIVDTNAALDTTAGDSLQHVTNLTLVGASANININEPVTLASTGVLTLNTTGTSTQGASGALTVSGAGSGLVLLGAGGTHTLTNSSNSIPTVAGTTGSVNLTDSVPLTVNTVAPSTGPTTSNLTASGSVTLTDDSIALTAATGQILASGQTVTLEPQTTTKTVDIGGSTGGNMNLSPSSLNDIAANTLVIGNTSDNTGSLIVDANLAATAPTDALKNVTNLTLIGGSGNITLNNPITLASTGLLTLNTTGTATQVSGAPVTVSGTGSGLLLLGTNGAYSLTSSTNSVGTLAANVGTGTGSVNLADGATSLKVSSLNSTVGITAGTLTLTDIGTVTQDQAITATKVDLEGIGGTYTLTNSSNAIGTLAGNVGTTTGSINLWNGSNALSVGTVNSTNGVTAGTLTLNDNGTVSQTQSITATNLDLEGRFGVYNLNGATANAVSTLAANTNSVGLNDGSTPLTVGTVNSAVGVAATSVALTDTATVGQSQAITTNTLDLEGAGGAYTLNNSGNIIGQLAGSTGSVSLTDAIQLLVAAVNSRNNLTTTGASGISLTDTAGGGITLDPGTGSLSSSGAGPITLTSDFQSLGNTVTATGQTVTLEPYTLSIGVDVGGATTPGYLNLSAQSLSEVSANTLAIGNMADTTHPLKVDQNLDANASDALQHVTNLTLNGGSGGININDPVTLASTGVLTLDTTATGTQAASGAGMTVSGASSGLLLLGGTGTVYTLTGAGNVIPTLAVSVGSGTANLNDGSTALSIGTVGGVNGVTAATQTLTDTGTVTQTQAISANLDLLGTGGVYTLNLASNAVPKLAGNTGSVDLSDGSALTVNTVNGTNNLTTTAGVRLSDNSIALTAATGLISAAGQTVILEPLTTTDGVDIGGTTAGDLQLTTASLGDITAATLALGNGAGTTTTNALLVDAALSTSSGLQNVTNLSLMGGSTGITINQPVTLVSTGVLNLETTGTASQASAGILTTSGTGGGLLLRGAGTFNLNNATNSISTLATGAGAASPTAISLTNGGTNLSVGTLSTKESGALNGVAVSGTGVTAGTATLTDTGTVSQISTAPVTVTNLDLLGSGGTYTLNTDTGNAVTTLAGSTGAVNLTDSSALTINTVGSTNNLATTGSNGITLTDSAAGGISTNSTNGALSSTSGPITLMANAISLGTTVTASGQVVTLEPYTGGTAITVGGTAAGFDVNTAAIAEVTASTLLIGNTSAGAISVSSAIDPTTVTNLGLLSGSTVTQTAGSTITVPGLEVKGTTETLAQNNAVSTVAMSGTGPISFYSASALTVGTVNGLYGVKSTGGAVLVNTGNNLILALGSGAAVSGVGSGSAVQLVDNGTFTNNEGSGALTVTSGGGRWLVWSLTPLNDNIGSLAYVFKQYAATYGTTTPADSTDNGVMYTLAPVVTPGLIGSVVKTYDGTNTATLTAGNFSAATGAVAGDTVTLTTSTTGTYDTANQGTGKSVTATGISIASQTNGSATVYGYTLSTATATNTIGTINAATLTYTANLVSQTYGTAIPTLSGTITGFVDGQTQASATTGTMSFGTSAGQYSNVGSYAINGTGLTANNGNYIFTQASTNATALTITKATLTYNANTLSQTYGTAIPTLTGTVTGFLGTDNQASATSGTLAFGTSAGQYSNVGTYAINGSGLTATNYNFVQAAGNATALTITKATLTYNANTLSQTYGTAIPTLTGTVTGFLGTDNQASATSGTLAFGASAGQYSNVGTYAINGSGLTATNYNFVQAAGNATALTINKATLTYTATPVSQVYQTAIPTLTGTVTGFLGTDNQASATSGTLTFTTTALQTSNIGSYPITGSGLTATNYNFVQAAANSTAFTITPATLTLTYNATPVTLTYGTAIPTLTGTVTGFRGSDTLANATTGTLVFTTTATQTSNVGSYPITGSGLTANFGNYTFQQASGNSTALTIVPATLTYTANPVSQLYGTAIPSLSGTVTGFVLGQSQSTATTGTASFTTSATQSSNVGSYAINGSGLTANNGDYTFVQASSNSTALTINPVTLTYTATPVSQTYGTAIPTLAGTITGFVLGQTQSSATSGTMAFTTPATQSSNVGSYAINGSGLTANYGDYTFVQAAANSTAFTITPAALTLVYNATPVSQTYGTAIPTLTGTVTGFLLGQTQATATTGTLVFTTTATQTSNVGSYPITGSGLTAINGDYTFMQAPGNSTAFTITPATLTYNATPVSQVYGTAIPTVTGNVTGFVLGQTLASATAGTLGFTTQATQSSNVGSYSITGSGLTANNGDYVFVQASGNSTAFAITPAALTYTANLVSQVYGTAIPTLNGTLTGFVLGQTQATATTGTMTFTTPATQSSNVGSYSITGSGLTANNGDYTFKQAAGNSTAFAITPATLTYTADPVSQVSGAAIPTLTGTITGFVLGQTLSSATTGTAVFTTPATATSAPGDYPIDGSGLTSVNYVFVQAPANATALTLQPFSTQDIVQINTATTTLPNVNNVNNNSGSSSGLAFFGGEFNGIQLGSLGGSGGGVGGGSGGGGGSAATTALPAVSGEADTTIHMGRFAVTYEVDIQNGRETNVIGGDIIGMASSFTTFEKEDRPSTQIRHKARGDEKDRDKNENANGPVGSS